LAASAAPAAISQKLSAVAGAQRRNLIPPHLATDSALEVDVQATDRACLFIEMLPLALRASVARADLRTLLALCPQRRGPGARVRGLYHVVHSRANDASRHDPDTPRFFAAHFPHPFFRL